MITTVREYFLTIAPIWQRYFDKKISMVERDALLAHYRKILKSL